MTRTSLRLAFVGIALLLVASALPPSGGTATAAEHTFVIEQGSRCVEVTPLSGSEDVVSFYDYRNIENDDGSTRFTYSSYMPQHLTREDVSRLFLYDGPNGVSLVIVHNAVGGDEGDGSAATFHFGGLPSSGSWVVQDDDYAGQDDRWSRTRADWMWYGDRTDGGVFRGLDHGGTEITISAAFDENAALYDDFDRTGNTRAWQFLTGSLGSPGAVGLDTSQPITIRTGQCGPDETPPSASLSAGSGVVGQSVTFDARGSSDDRGVAAYRWDFDGDGEIDRETTDPVVTHAYDASGTYDATVTVVDGGDNADAASATVAVEPDDPPNATFETGDSPTVGFPVTLDASDSGDDVGIAAYRWDFDGDGEIDRETTDPAITTTYDEAGSYEVSLTVVDSGGKNATATRTVAVDADDPPDPAIRVESPGVPGGQSSGDAVEGQQVVFDASNSTDDTGIAEYRWSFGDGTTATGERVAHTYAENGTYTATLEVVDEGGNNATATSQIEVLPPDETPPDAAVTAAPSRVEAGANVTLDAGESEDARGVVSYQWDFDGDGQTDRTTESATVRHAYGSADTYDATVVVTDGGGNADSANVTVEVLARDETPPSASLSVSTNQTEEGTEITFNASNTTDGETTITEYRWDFDGDDEIDRTTSDATVEHAYGSAGEYNATVVVADFGNNTDDATVQVVVEENEQAHRGSSGGSSAGGSGSSSVGPPPVDESVEQTGPNEGLVDVRNGRADETIRTDLPESEAASETGVAFRSVAVDLSADDPHFAVETARPDAESPPADVALGSPPADVTLGSLAVDGKYVQNRQVSGVTWEVAIQKSRLDEAGLAPADLTAYQRTGDERTDNAWEQVNATVEERGEAVILRVEADALASIAVGAERSVTVTDAALDAETVAADEPVSVTTTVRNEGEETAEFTASLTADGEVVATKTVEIPAGETMEVTVEETLSPGSHEVGLDGQSLGSVTVAEPVAEVGVAAVSLNESTIAAGEQVAITATVENTGSKAGEETVALTLFGEQVDSETVEVPAGETKDVTFVRQVAAPGTYTATVGNETAELKVTGDSGQDGDGSAAPEVPIPGFGIGVGLVALLAAALLARLRAESE